MEKNSSLTKRLLLSLLILTIAYNVSLTVLVSDLLSHSAAPEEIKRKDAGQSSRKRNGFTFFHLDKQPFIQVFVDCLKDPNCSIQYLHRTKTGGTFFEYKMSAILGIERKPSCCDKSMLDRFMNSSMLYCKAPFSSYQLSVPTFKETILKKCEDIFHGKAKMETMLLSKSKDLKETSNFTWQRMVVLVTYREPVARVISTVHQICNKILNRRPKSVRKICRRCNYYDDPKYYNLLYEKELEELHREMLANRTFWSSTMDRDGSVVDGLLAIDNAEINSFFEDLMSFLPPELKDQLNIPSHLLNVEKKQFCDFKVPSAMVKKMSRVILLYRNISMGVA